MAWYDKEIPARRRREETAISITESRVYHVPATATTAIVPAVGTVLPGDEGVFARRVRGARLMQASGRGLKELHVQLYQPVDPPDQTVHMDQETVTVRRRHMTPSEADTATAATGEYALGAAIDGETGHFRRRVRQVRRQELFEGASVVLLTIEYIAPRVGTRPAQETGVSLSDFELAREESVRILDGGRQYTLIHQVPRQYIEHIRANVSVGSTYDDPYDAWDSETAYEVDDVVAYGGSHYRCYSAVAWEDGDPANDDPASDTDHWYQTVQLREALRVEDVLIQDEWPGRPGFSRVVVRTAPPDDWRLLAGQPAGRAIVEASISAQSYKVTHDMDGNLIEGPTADGQFYRRVIAGSNVKYHPRCSVRVHGVASGPFPLAAVAAAVGSIGSGMGLGDNTLLFLGASRYRRILGSDRGIVTMEFLYEPAGWDEILRSGKFKDLTLRIPVMEDDDGDPETDPVETDETRTVHRIIRVVEDDGSGGDSNATTHRIHSEGSFAALPIETRW